jgi:hypothetical protein
MTFMDETRPFIPSVGTPVTINNECRIEWARGRLGTVVSGEKESGTIEVQLDGIDQIDVYPESMDLR